MRRIKLTLSYLGTAYNGWQRQPNGDTVQERIEKAITSLTKEQVSIQGSGRTDAGVHALKQVAHFDTSSLLPLKNFVTGLNHFLPPDIRIEKAEEVSAQFHARYSAVEKTYRYLIYDGAVEKAVHLNRAVFVKGKLDAKRMDEASKAFLGEHDFTSFMSTGADTTTSVRTVKKVSVRRSGGLIVIEITANGFLYNMVRLIAGALVRAGKGELDKEGIAKLIERADKNAVYEVMAPYGLYLKSVKYPSQK